MSRSFIVAASLAIVQAKDHCNAVALSGGGSNGAWEVGVIWGLTHYGNPQDFEWDWVTGVSAGSINTAGLAGWAPGEEKMASEWLSYTMTTMKTSDVWQLWPNTTLVDALTKKPSLVNSAPAL
jgi:predicted acylesterase/phospholipase RssA